ncbi:MAG: ABC transporter permease [Actinomycetes bacterium]
MTTIPPAQSGPSELGQGGALASVLGGVRHDDEKGVSLWRGASRRLRRNPSAVLGASIMLAFVLVALLAPVVAGYEPGRPIPNSGITPSSVPGPSPEHPWGLDSTGADLLTQMVFGARQSLVIGVVSTAIGFAAGAALGLLSGGVGGRVDTAVMRLVDIMLSIPSLLLAVSIAAVLGQSPASIMIAVGVAQVPIFARLLRGSMLTQRNSDYAVAAQALGVRRGRIVFGHVLPNSLSPVIVQATLSLATAIIEAAALSFLGLGDPDLARPEWGAMLANAQDFLSIRPALAVWPALCIIVVALGFTLLGERLREALDPKFRR